MKKVIFIGLLAIGTCLSTGSFAQERVRSNQVKREYNKTRDNLQNGLHNTTDTLKRGYDRVRSDFRHEGDTLRNQWNRARSNADTIRNQYDQRRHNVMNRDTLNKEWRRNQ